MTHFKESELCLLTVSDTTLLKDIYIFAASKALNEPKLLLFFFSFKLFLCMVNAGLTLYRNVGPLALNDESNCILR